MTSEDDTKAAERPKWVRVADLADALDVSRKTVGLWIKNGQVQAIRTPGGQYRIPVEEFDRVLSGAA